MNCQKCNAVIMEGSLFCDHCGEKITQENMQEVQENIQEVQENSIETMEQPREIQEIEAKGIIKDEQGTQRWTYDMNMWKNPTLIVTIAKILLFTSLIPALLVAGLELENGIVSSFQLFIKVAALIIGIVFVLLLIAYPFVAVMQGGKYCVVFEMNEAGVNHIQMQKQFKRNQILAMITVVAGAASGNLSVAGAGLLSGSKQSSYTKFSKVKSIKVKSKNHVIYLNEALNKNQIYVDATDFNFVLTYILERCPKARVIYK